MLQIGCAGNLPRVKCHLPLINSEFDRIFSVIPDKHQKTALFSELTGDALKYCKYSPDFRITELLFHHNRLQMESEIEILPFWICACKEIKRAERNWLPLIEKSFTVSESTQMAKMFGSCTQSLKK